MPLPHSGSFKPGDPRASAAGRKGRRKPILSKSQQAVEDFINTGMTLPEGHVAPSAGEIQELARSLMPATMAFCAAVMGDAKASMTDKFSAARMMVQYGGATLAADAEEIAKLSAMLTALQEEHRKTLADARKDHAKTVAEMTAALEELKAAHLSLEGTHATLTAEAEALKQERDRLAAALEEAKARPIRKVA